MKKTLISVTLFLLLVSFVLTLSGCAKDQMGETVAEGHRRHVRLLRIQRQQMWEDIDAFLLLERPTRLGERTIP